MESDDLLSDLNKQPTQPSPNESIINNISLSTDTPNTKSSLFIEPDGKSSCQKDEKRRFMAKYLDIDVPAVLVTDLDSYEKKGWREPGADQSDYFNYGYNEVLYKLYIERIKSRLVDLKTKIDLKQIELNNDKSLKKYLFSFPSDFGGIGDILNGNQYENVRLFEPNNNEGKTIPILEHQQGRFMYNIDKNLSNEMPTNYIPQHVHYHNNFPRMPNAPVMDMRIPMPHFNFYDPMAFGIPNFPGHPHVDEELEKKDRKKKEKKEKKSKKYKSKRSSRSSSYSRSYSRSRSRHRNKRRSDSRNKSEKKTRKDYKKH